METRYPPCNSCALCALPTLADLYTKICRFFNGADFHVGVDYHIFKSFEITADSPNTSELLSSHNYTVSSI